MGVRAGILPDAAIGLDLGEAHGHVALARAVGEQGAEQRGRELDRVAGQGGAVEHHDARPERA